MNTNTKITEVILNQIYSLKNVSRQIT